MAPPEGRRGGALSIILKQIFVAFSTPPPEGTNRDLSNPANPVSKVKVKMKHKLKYVMKFVSLLSVIQQ